MIQIAKTDVTFQLEKAISRATSKLGTFSCFEVTIGFGGNERVDYMTVDTKGIWRCYEVKCSVSDFRSKAKNTFVGHFNYFVMTSELYEKVKDEIPSHIGVYIGDTCKKKPKKQELKVDEDVLLMSMIRSLSRDASKLYTLENPNVISGYKSSITRLTDENKEMKRKIQFTNMYCQAKFGRDWNSEFEY